MKRLMLYGVGNSAVAPGPASADSHIGRQLWSKFTTCRPRFGSELHLLCHDSGPDAGSIDSAAKSASNPRDWSQKADEVTISAANPRNVTTVVHAYV